MPRDHAPLAKHHTLPLKATWASGIAARSLAASEGSMISGQHVFHTTCGSRDGGTVV